ncbi:MAG: tetratricopeptide repeat protein [Pseudomonadota bacterium]
MTSDPVTVLKEAKKLISINKLNEAKVLLQPLITELRKDSRVYALLGFIYHKQGEFTRAIKNYRTALDLNGTDVETAINLSLIYNDLGKYDQGSELYAKAVDNLGEKRGENIDEKRTHDDNVDLMLCKQHVGIGELYLRYNRAEEALLEFQKALHLSPKYYTVYADIAECYSRLGKRKQAIKELRGLKLKIPQAFDARVKLGHLLFLEGEIGSAVEEWDSVVKDNPDNVEARMYIKMAQNQSILP